MDTDFKVGGIFRSALSRCRPLLPLVFDERPASGLALVSLCVGRIYTFLSLLCFQHADCGVFYVYIWVFFPVWILLGLGSFTLGL